MERAIIIYLDVSDKTIEEIIEFKSSLVQYIEDGFLADEDFEDKDLFIDPEYISQLKLVKLLICYSADGIYNLDNVIGSLKCWDVIDRLRRLDTMPLGQYAYDWKKEFERKPNIFKRIKNKLMK